MEGDGQTDELKMLSGLCPDEKCGTKLYFPSYDVNVECPNCGQRHSKKRLKDVQKVSNTQVAAHNVLKNILVGNLAPKKTDDTVKYLGISNYQCKLLSPLLTTHGYDKQSQKARLLSDMGKAPVFDCGLLADKSFLIESDQLEVVGYGRDCTGSMKYLRATLEAIQAFNDGEERLLPVHADGDGHCLVHAISRALVGRELFWHSLRENLTAHLTQHAPRYRALLLDFMDDAEWKVILNESDPNFLPRDGEAMGLGNVHIFGLANVLKRPIILLDSVGHIQSKGDYSGVFLPALVDPMDCRGRDGRPHPPICLAWSGSGHNHFVALIAIKGRALPRLPSSMVPRVWGLPQDQAASYLHFDSDGCLVLSGDKGLSAAYVSRLVACMEEVFLQNHKVTTALVTDVHQYIYKAKGYTNLPPNYVLEQTQRAVHEQRLYRCLTCGGLSELALAQTWLQQGGNLYSYIREMSGGTLTDMQTYNFEGQQLTYDAERDELVPNPAESVLSQCLLCKSSMVRHVCLDGSIEYQDGDKTTTASNSTRCQCGFKHYWGGREYDNLPILVPVRMAWRAKVVEARVPLWIYESDETFNSNVYEVARRLVHDHFPGEFGSERLEQQVVQTLLMHTEALNPAPPVSPPPSPTPSPTPLSPANPSSLPVYDVGRGAARNVHQETDASWRHDQASKIILTGLKKKTMHKEELTASATERKIQENIKSRASAEQHRRSAKTSREQGDAVAMEIGSPMKTPTSPVPAPSPPMVTPSSISPPTQKLMRVSTSDGRQLTLPIQPKLTCGALRELLAAELGIPVNKQRIRHGFPPRPLCNTSDPPDTPLIIQHGDKITVDVLQTPTTPITMETSPIDHGIDVSEDSSAQSWSNSLLSGLEGLESGGTDSVDRGIQYMELLVQLTGRDLWDYVQHMPQLFSAGGLFYQQVQRDLGLTHHRHCTLPALPTKVFRYSADEDRLELCLEPHGHFPVEPGVEARALGSSPTPSPTATATATATDPHKPSFHAFGGPGHSLSSPLDAHMPTDLPIGQHRSAQYAEPQNIVTMETSSSEGVTKDVAVDSPVTADEGRRFRRIGPGYTVLDPPISTEMDGAHAARLHQLTSQIEALVQHQDDALLAAAMATPPTVTTRTLSDPSSEPTEANADATLKTSRAQTDTDMHAELHIQTRTHTDTHTQHMDNS